MNDSLAVVSCAVPEAAVDGLFEVIDAERFTPTAWFDVEKQACRVDVFLEDASLAESVKGALVEAGALLGLSLSPTFGTLARSDWSESWKRFFHVEKISPRVVVRPSWEAYDAQPGERVITLDPGLSFGTGKHATTQACLKFLDALAAEDPQRSVLDMGCGSGILAIGAKLLGFVAVRGFDNDTDCIQVSNENAAINGVEVPFFLDDLSHPHEAADVVVANILAPVLIQFAAQVAGSAAPGPQARLVVSGILDEQYAAVRAAYEAQGLVEVESLLIENWRSGLFRRG
ncbi:MAG: 50S ribosomal protein L11 methyltransferase [Kiritimatiellae bacterium]|nr:50S ribosomal protein L11 methyltransferase [Kiritimatiellia bacterium]